MDAGLCISAGINITFMLKFQLSYRAMTDRSKTHTRKSPQVLASPGDLSFLVLTGNRSTFGRPETSSLVTSRLRRDRL